MPTNVKPEIQGIAQAIFKSFFSCVKMTGDNPEEAAVLSEHLSEIMSGMYSLMGKLGCSTVSSEIPGARIDRSLFPSSGIGDPATDPLF